MPYQKVSPLYPGHGCCKLLLYISTACTHCIISQDCNLHSPAPLWELQISILYFFPPFLCLHCLVLWEETSFYFNITGACLMCLNGLLSPSGRTIIKSWIINQLPCKTEKSVYVSCFLCSKWTHFAISPIEYPLNLYTNNVIKYFFCKSLFL